MLILMTGWVWSSVAMAQPDRNNNQPDNVPDKIPRGVQQQPAKTQTVAQVTSPSKSYVAEGIIVGILFGGCLFVICKTSWRR